MTKVGKRNAAEFEAIVQRAHSDPHSVLGAHKKRGGAVVRAIRPAAESVSVVLPDGAVTELQEVHPGGLFEGTIEGATVPLSYRLKIDYADDLSLTIDDPYFILPN